MVVVVVAKIAWWWLWIPRNPLALLVAPSWHGLGGGCKICLVVVGDSAESISTASST